MTQVHRRAWDSAESLKQKTSDDQPYDDAYAASYELESIQHKFTEIKEKISDKTFHSFSEINSIIISLADEEIPKVQKHLDNLKSNRAENKEQIEKLEEDIKALKEELALAKSEIARLEKKNQELNDRVTALEQSSRKNSVTIALLTLGQVATEIQNAMYKNVLPDMYNAYTAYKIPQILDDIKDQPDIKSQREAEDRLKILLSRLNWNKNLERALRNLSQSRNREAHPTPVNETALPEYVDTLDKQGCFTGSPSLEEVNRLIEIWKELKPK